MSESLNSSNPTNTQNNQPLSARTIWGKVIIYLREHRSVALHIACGDIGDVEFVGDKFIINTTEDFLYELLKNKDNQNDLALALKANGVQNYEVVKKEKTTTKSQRDLEKLKQIFNKDLIIEGD